MCLGSLELNLDPRTEPIPRTEPGWRRQVGEAVCLSSLSYHEAWELSYFGASVLHPRTTMPARKFGIPIVIRNFFNQGAAGARLPVCGAICCWHAASTECISARNASPCKSSLTALGNNFGIPVLTGCNCAGSADAHAPLCWTQSCS